MKARVIFITFPWADKFKDEYRNYHKLTQNQFCSTHFGGAAIIQCINRILHQVKTYGIILFINHTLTIENIYQVYIINQLS